MKPRRLSLLLLLSLLAAPPPARSQSTPTEIPATPTPAPVPLQEVAERSQGVAALLRDIEDSLQPKPELAALREGLPKWTSRVDELQAESNAVLAGSPSRIALDGIQGSWTAATVQLNTWNELLTVYARELESRREQLIGIRAIWEATRDATRAEAAPAAIVERINQTLSAVRATRKKLESTRDEILVLQDHIAKLLARGAEVNRDVARQRNQMLGRLIERDARPVWQIDWSVISSAEAAPRAAQSLADQWKNLREYGSANFGYIVLHLVVFAALIPLLMNVRNRIPGWVERNPQVARAMPVVALPISSALLASTLTVVWFYPPGPAVLLVGVLSLVPTLRILRRLVDRIFLPVVHTFAAFFLLDRFRHMFDLRPESAQILLIVQIAVSLTAVVWLVATRRLPLGTLISGALAARAVEYASRALVGVFTVSLLAACLGFMRLAEWLVSNFLMSGYFAIGLYATYRVGQGIVAYAVRSDAGRALRLTQHPVVERRLTTGLRWLAVAGWVVTALLLFDLFNPLVSGLRTALTAQLEMGEVSLSLGAVIAFASTVWLSFALSRFVRFVLAEDVFPRFPLARGVPYAVSTLVHYSVLLTGFFLAFAAMGLDLNRFTVLAGAFGVGIGFGMQNIINNFVSGIILLFERPIQVGDVVQLGALSGEVTRIGIRSSAVRTPEGAEVIVPNAMFVSDTVTNWTLSDRLRRIDIAVGVAYGSEPARVLDLLREVATNHPLVLTEPPPAALFVGFGDSALNFELRAWTSRFEEWVRIRSELNLAVHDALRGAGIVIPFPRRDIAVDAPVDVRLVGHEKPVKGEQ
jgi:small-conductance mechanosensitive channel